MLEDDLTTLAELGRTKLAFTDGTPEQQARLAAKAAITANLEGAIAALHPVVVASDFSSAANLANTVAAAGNLAVCLAVRAQLA